MRPYRVELVGRAFAQVAGLPEKIRDVLVAALVEVSEDPYSALYSRPTDDPLERSATFDDGRGFVLFLVEDAARIMTVYHVTWAG